MLQTPAPPPLYKKRIVILSEARASPQRRASQGKRRICAAFCRRMLAEEQGPQTVVRVETIRCASSRLGASMLRHQVGGHHAISISSPRDIGGADCADACRTKTSHAAAGGGAHSTRDSPRTADAALRDRLRQSGLQ